MSLPTAYYLAASVACMEKDIVDQVFGAGIAESRLLPWVMALITTKMKDLG